MSGTLWLITEGKIDYQIIRALVRHHHPQVKVEPQFSTGSKPNISQLAKQIEKLIKTVQSKRKPGDCIAVVHDADMHRNPTNRKEYNAIKEICEREEYRAEVVLIVIPDEIEAWLLADHGLCEWLGIKPTNYDDKPKPKDDLESYLYKAGKPRYRIENMPQILKHLDGTADQHSQSLRGALRHLQNAPCTRA